MDFATSIKMHHATRTKADKLVVTLAAEYPRLTLVAVEGEAIDHDKYEYECGGFEVLLDEDEAIYESDKVPELADILDACVEEGVDPSDVDGSHEEDANASGSLVKQKYRESYKSASENGQTCGDWLAERITDDTTDAKGKLITDDLVALFTNNGLDMNAKWALQRFTQVRGWQGRFRMSGRIALEKLIPLSNVYVDATGFCVTPPADWLALMETKHAKWLKKERSKAAVAEKSIKQAVEG